MKVSPGFLVLNDDFEGQSQYPLLSRKTAMATALAIAFIAINLLSFALNEKQPCVVGEMCAGYFVCMYCALRLRRSTTPSLIDQTMPIWNMVKNFKRTFITMLLMYSPRDIGPTVMRECFLPCFLILAQNLPYVAQYSHLKPIGVDLLDGRIRFGRNEELGRAVIGSILIVIASIVAYQPSWFDIINGFSDTVFPFFGLLWLQKGLAEGHMMSLGHETSPSKKPSEKDSDGSERVKPLSDSELFWSLLQCISVMYAAAYTWQFLTHNYFGDGVYIGSPQEILFVIGVGVLKLYLLVHVFFLFHAPGTAFLFLWIATVQLIYLYPSYETLTLVGIMLVSAWSCIKTSLEDLEEGASTFRSRRRHILLVAGLSLLTLLSFKGALDPRNWVRVDFPTSKDDILPTTNSSVTLDLGGSSGHPIPNLVGDAQKEFSSTLGRQSGTLGAASAEYKARYDLPPPPHFDQWFEYVKQRGVQIVDDYDIIHDSIQPFWSLKPAKLRERVREALGYEENALIALLIRKGKVAKIKGGLPWQQEAILGMTKSFVHMLPDMDIAFNAHDEPRIVVPHDELSQMIAHAKTGSMRRALENEDLRNAFSAKPDDMTNGKRIQEHSVSRFNEYAHQNTWVPSRLSCSPNSPARDFTETSGDNYSAYAIGELGFIRNTTAFSDVCMSPSLKGRHAFFDRPNAFSVAHDLIPVFSESKISSFQDIPFPSLWHWYGKLFLNTTSDMHLKNEDLYEEDKDPEWENKTNILWWRGSTTGGYSREGGWRRQHRQRVVRKFNGLDKTTVLRNPDMNNTLEWRSEKVRRSDYRHLVDIKFSGICQCDPGDCESQEEFFDVAPYANVSSTWQHKHLLDMDGNAFSARFYGLMRSKSLVYKMAIFREWHDEWLKPWLHYIPISLQGDEYLEVIRYFAEDEEGKDLARRLALKKREWAMKALRREDMEAWFFRLLLEYGRVMQDDREEIGFAG